MSATTVSNGAIQGVAGGGSGVRTPQPGQRDDLLDSRKCGEKCAEDA